MRFWFWKEILCQKLSYCAPQWGNVIGVSGFTWGSFIIRGSDNDHPRDWAESDNVTHFNDSWWSSSFRYTNIFFRFANSTSHIFDFIQSPDFEFHIKSARISTNSNLLIFSFIRNRSPSATLPDNTRSPLLTLRCRWQMGRTWFTPMQKTWETITLWLDMTVKWSEPSQADLSKPQQKSVVSIQNSFSCFVYCIYTHQPCYSLQWQVEKHPSSDTYTITAKGSQGKWTRSQNKTGDHIVIYSSKSNGWSHHWKLIDVETRTTEPIMGYLLPHSLCPLVRWS